MVLGHANNGSRADGDGGCQIGTGEYTTGWTPSGASGSDKKVGVVGLTLFDLRRRGKVGRLGMVGVNGTKFPAIREFPCRERERPMSGQGPDAR